MGVCFKEKRRWLEFANDGQHSTVKKKGFEIFFKQYKPGFLKTFKKIWKYFQEFQKFENKFFKKFVHCGGAGRGWGGFHLKPIPIPIPAVGMNFIPVPAPWPIKSGPIPAPPASLIISYIASIEEHNEISEKCITTLR